MVVSCGGESSIAPLVKKSEGRREALDSAAILLTETLNIQRLKFELSIHWLLFSLCHNSKMVSWGGGGGGGRIST